MTNPAVPPFKTIAIAIIQRDDEVLICRRPEGVPLGGYWEFPGGKQEAGETLEQCVVRECQEELGIGVAPIRALPVIEYHYDHGGVRIHPFICSLESGKPAARQASDVRWIRRNQLSHYRFPPANTSLLKALQADDG